MKRLRCILLALVAVAASAGCSDDPVTPDDAQGVAPGATVTISSTVAYINVEKYVSTDGGTTWLDADDAPGPTVLVGSSVQFKFVVTNVSVDKSLGGVSLLDSDFSLAACTIPMTLSVGGSFECVISSTATAGQHTNTATASGSHTDGGGSSYLVNDTDDANYFGSVDVEIDVEKYVSVDGGITWSDADAPTGPHVAAGSPVKFKFVVTNAGSAPLSGISLADSDFSVGGCAIPTTLPGDGSFECIIGSTAIAGQHMNLATASGSYTDGASNTQTDTDIDAAHYFGMTGGQASIQINSLSISINAARTTVTGQFAITDESLAGRKLDGFLVAITDYGVRWEQKGAAFSQVGPTGGCTYSIEAADYAQPPGWTPGDPIVLDENVTIGYTCTFGGAQLLAGGKLKGTAYARVYSRPDKEFSFSRTASIPR